MARVSARGNIIQHRERFSNQAVDTRCSQYVFLRESLIVPHAAGVHQRLTVPPTAVYSVQKMNLERKKYLIEKSHYLHWKINTVLNIAESDMGLNLGATLTHLIYPEDV